MNPYGKIFRILSGSWAIRRVCFGLLFDDLTFWRDVKEFVDHPDVERFEGLVSELTGMDPEKLAGLKKNCRQLWPEEVTAGFDIAKGPGLEAFEDMRETPILSRSYDYLLGGLVSDVMALQIACLVKGEEQGAPEVKTSDVTTLLRASGYKIPNPAALIRSLADRADPVIEVLNEKIGPRQELQFRLLPHAAEDLRARILASGNVHAA